MQFVFKAQYRTRDVTPLHCASCCCHCLDLYPQFLSLIQTLAPSVRESLILKQQGPNEKRSTAVRLVFESSCVPLGAHIVFIEEGPNCLFFQQHHSGGNNQTVRCLVEKKNMQKGKDWLDLCNRPSLFHYTVTSPHTHVHTHKQPLTLYSFTIVAVSHRKEDTTVTFH